MAKLALLIGVSEYESGLKPLPAAVKDIEAMRRVLEHPDMGSFNEVEALANPDSVSMQVAIETLFSERAKKDDLVLFFFSGHGVKDAMGKLHFATRSTRKNYKGELIKATAVSSSFVQGFLKDCRCRRKVVVLDCCFSGAFAEGMTAKDDGSVDVKAQLGGEGQAVLASSTSTQYSFEQQDSDLSIYTRYFVEGLKTGDADQNRDGSIAIDELHDYIKRKVQEVAPQMKPEIYPGKEGYKITLARVPPTDPESRYRRRVEQLADQGEITFAPRTLIDRARDWLNMPPRDDVQISPVRRKTLTVYSQNLGLSPEVASQTEEKALQPYRRTHKDRESYRQALISELRRGKPLKGSALSRLKDYQRELNISDKHAAAIEQKAFRRARQLTYSDTQDLQVLVRSVGSKFLILFITTTAVVLITGLFTTWLQVFQTNQQPNESNVSPSESPLAVPSPTLTEPAPSPSNTISPPSESAPNPDLFPDVPPIKTHEEIGTEYYNIGNQRKEQGSTEVAKKYYQDAIKEFRQAIIQQPENAGLFIKRGDTYFALGDCQAAFQDYKKAIELKPTTLESLAQVYERRGESRDRCGDRQGAIDDYREAIKRYFELGGGPNVERVQSKLRRLQIE